MFITTLDKLINAGLIKLDDHEPELSTVYVVADGFVLLDKDGDRITSVYVCHDDNDSVVLFKEADPDNPMNIDWNDLLKIRIYKEVFTESEMDLPI